MNTPVSFEIAKLLKEKGFDEPCSHYYILDFKNFIADGVLYKCGLPDGEEHTNTFQFVRRKNQPHIANAPTIAEVVMWLYEKHGIWIYVKQGYKWEWYIETVSNHPELKYKDGLEDSPTEAYEAAIEYTLNNLI
jgi:hypothetical protein